MIIGANNNQVDNSTNTGNKILLFISSLIIYLFGSFMSFE